MSGTTINIISATQIGEYRIRLVFDDNAVQEVDFKPVPPPAHSRLSGVSPFYRI